MDRDLREAERSGDGVALVRDRLRAGELSQEQVKLAARLGHPAASELLPELEVVDLADHEVACEALALAVKILEDDTLHACLATESAQRILHVWEGEFADDTRPREALVAARAWLACPCVQHTLEAGSAGNLLGHVFRTEQEEHLLIHSPDVFERVSAAGQAASSAAISARTVGTGVGVVTGIRAAWSALDSAASAGEDPGAEREWQRSRLAAYVLDEV